MYHTVLPVTTNHNPIVVEGQMKTQLIIFNAGPSSVEAEVWNNWDGNVDGDYPDNAYKPNLKLELRAGNEKIISGCFIRVQIKNSKMNYAASEQFAAIGVRVI